MDLVNTRNDAQQTPLHVAILMEHFAYAQALVEAGADVDILTKEGTHLLDMVMDATYIPFRLVYAMLRRTKLRTRVVAAAREYMGKLLGSAKSFPPADLIELLLSEFDADPNMVLSDRFGVYGVASPIMFAAAKNDLDTCRVLIKYGANARGHGDDDQLWISCIAASTKREEARALLALEWHPSRHEEFGPRHNDAVAAFLLGMQHLVNQGVVSALDPLLVEEMLGNLRFGDFPKTVEWG